MSTLRRRRRQVSVDTAGWVRTSPLFEGKRMPLLAEPNHQGIDLTHWLAEHRQLVEQWVTEAGCVLFRGFLPPDPAQFRKASLALAGELLEYAERSSPRHQVAQEVYTSTDYPAHYPIFLHNENSYQGAWPMRLFFFCQTAASEGGETPLADCRAIRADVPREIVEAFQKRGVMYVRNYNPKMGLPWQTVFQTEDPAEVDAYCTKAGLETEWLSKDRLRTKARRPAVCFHPVLGEPTWFNHATFFHISTLRHVLGPDTMAGEAEENLPNNSYWGDGSPIEDDILATLREIYLRHEVRFPWQEGDFLVLDNMLCAHGRATYSGDRAILVAMAQPMDAQHAWQQTQQYSDNRGDHHA